MFKFLRDITNLYESRDSIWKELFKLQQTSKRRHKELLQRIHLLERLNVKPRGKNETFEANQDEAESPYTQRDCERFAQFREIPPANR